MSGRFQSRGKVVLRVWWCPGSAGLAAGLCGIKSPFQPKPFCGFSTCGRNYIPRNCPLCPWHFTSALSAVPCAEHQDVPMAAKEAWGPVVLLGCRSSPPVGCGEDQSHPGPLLALGFTWMEMSNGGCFCGLHGSCAGVASCPDPALSSPSTARWPQEVAADDAQASTEPRPGSFTLL